MENEIERLDEHISKLPDEQVRRFYRDLLIDQCEQDADIKEEASKVLSQEWLDGDSYFVPCSGCIVEELVKIILELRQTKT
jgi:hypothetical protein